MECSSSRMKRETQSHVLIAFVVAPGKAATHILSALRTVIDPIFLPRPLHVVPSSSPQRDRQAHERGLARTAARTSHRGAAWDLTGLITIDKTIHH